MPRYRLIASIACLTVLGALLDCAASNDNTTDVATSVAALTSAQCTYQGFNTSAATCFANFDACSNATGANIDDCRATLRGCMPPPPDGGPSGSHGGGGCP